MKRIGMLTSGGDCQALNAAMRGVVKCLSCSGEDVEIYGFLDGYKGLIYGDFRTTRTIGDVTQEVNVDFTIDFSNCYVHEVAPIIEEPDVIEEEPKAEHP